MTTKAMTANPGQRFIGLPSGRSYTADNSGNIAAVLQQDVVAMINNGCSVASATSVPSLPMSAGGTQSLTFASSGDIEYNVSLTSNCTFSITPPTTPNGYQRLILAITPNGFQATLPASVPGTLLNSGGAAPAPSASAKTIYTYAYDTQTVDGEVSL